MRKLLIILLTAISVIEASAQIMQDPALSGAVLYYSSRTNRQLDAQNAAIGLSVELNREMKTYIDRTTKYQEEFNQYLDTIRWGIEIFADIYGMYVDCEEVWRNMKEVKTAYEVARDKSKNRGEHDDHDELAILFSSNYSRCCTDVLTAGVDVVKDIWNLFSWKSKMTEYERLKMVYGIRPKLGVLNRKLRNLAFALRYTTWETVWDEVVHRRKTMERWAGTNRERRRAAEEALFRWQQIGGNVDVGHGFGETEGFVKVNE